MKHYATRSRARTRRAVVWPLTKSARSKIEWLKSTPCKIAGKPPQRNCNEKGSCSQAARSRLIGPSIREEFENNISEKLRVLAEQTTRLLSDWPRFVADWLRCCSELRKVLD